MPYHCPPPLDWTFSSLFCLPSPCVFVQLARQEGLVTPKKRNCFNFSVNIFSFQKYVNPWFDFLVCDSVCVCTSAVL